MGNLPSKQKALIKKMTAKGLEHWGHYRWCFHYGTIPLIFLFGLWYAGELTANPATLFAKCIFS